MPKIVDKEAKKMEILHAAMQVFAKKGVVKTKMIDIATLAGVGKGTIYEYFRSKEEIFYTAFNFFFENMELLAEEALLYQDDPVKQLRMLVEKSLEGMMHGGEEFAEIIMDFWAEGVRNKDQKMLENIDLGRIYHDYRIIIQKILNNGIKKGVFKNMDTFAQASVFIAAFDGIMLQWILDRKAVNLDKIADVLLESFLEGVKQR